MTGHVSEPTLLDVLEGGGAASDREHVAACSACAARLAEAAEGWSLALDAEVPEPPPFYWASLRRVVGRRIEAPRGTRWRLPAKVRRRLEELDAALTPIQQAKYRVLEFEVEQRMRQLVARARHPRHASR
jgi:hypothetical protein